MVRVSTARVSCATLRCNTYNVREQEMTQVETDAAARVTGTTMRAAVAHRFGGPEVVAVESVARPEAGSTQVLVRLHASTVSIADHRVRAKDLPKGLGFLAVVALGVFRPRKPILGMEGAGV